jgi:nucleotide-binding universal stress UspA family protein
MYKRMLVPLDGSALAEGILPYTRELARSLGLDVVLIHIADKKDSGTLLLHKAYVDRTADTIRRDIAKNQKKKSGVPRESQGIKVSGEVMVGSPAEEILSYADTNDIDLILMATHGRSGISRWVIGSVADKVLRSSRVPVLLVRTGIPQHIVDNEWPDTMLVPLDGSGLAELVLPHVAALAKQPNAKTVKVTLLMACEPPSMPAFAPPEFLANWGDMAAKQMAKSRNSAKKYLTRIEKQLNSAGLTVTSEVLEGQAAEEIVNYAAKNGSSLIVMATHGRSGLTRWAYGSVTEKVLLAASSPILLVRPASAGDPLPG